MLPVVSRLVFLFFGVHFFSDMNKEEAMND